ncbi:MAG: LacI family transcriptional regulator [Microbacteriaceae bacterium]|nr:LacI family transcriptional regulator [Microbacteriaceae bacterium]MCL2794607.1 LacI family transcriptional regulator [Microbacteriaceae bacterium]
MQRVTIATLAAQLGVSKASVSYALNGQPGVSEQTRERVVALANELGWHPSSSARALSRQRADAIGMVLRRDPTLLGTEPYYMRLLEGVESALSEAGQSLLLRMVGTAPGRDAAVYERWAAERRVDGVIVLDRTAKDPRPAQLTRLGMPFVLHGVLPADESGVERIENQHRDAELLIGHLAELGHRRIAHLTGPMHLTHEVDRTWAIERESTARGMSTVFAEADYTFDTAHARTAELLAAAERPTAIVCSNDVMALAALRALDEAGLAGEVALLSWDDSMLCQFASPTISALDRFPDRQGRRSAQMLLELLDGREFSSAEPSPSELHVRESSRRAQ